MIIRFFDADTGEPPPWPTDPQFIAAGGAAAIIDEGSTWEALSGTGSHASLSGYHRTTRRTPKHESGPSRVPDSGNADAPVERSR